MKLTKLERGWLHEIWDTMFPVDSGAGQKVVRKDLDVEGYLDDFERHMPRTVVVTLRLAALLVELAPLALFQGPRSFTRSDTATRLALLERLGRHPFYPVRAAVTFLKLEGAMHYVAPASTCTTDAIGGATHA